jgi:hypothetical protein
VAEVAVDAVASVLPAEPAVAVASVVPDDAVVAVASPVVAATVAVGAGTEVGVGVSPPHALSSSGMSIASAASPVRLLVFFDPMFLLH